MTAQEKAELKALAIDWVNKNAEATVTRMSEEVARNVVAEKMRALGVSQVWSANNLLTYKTSPNGSFELSLTLAEDIT